MLNFFKVLIHFTLVIITLFYSSLSFSGEYFVYEHIVISQDVTVSAHRLCQDGLFIYFISQKECLNTSGQFKCEGDLKIAPIRYVEKVYSEIGGISITQFYQINTNFEYRKYSLKEGFKDQLLYKYKKALPICKDKEHFEAMNVGRWRYANDDNEKSVIESLHQSGHVLVNTPYGQIRGIQNLNWNPLIEDKILVKPKANIKSPFCNDTISDNLVWKMSGEYTGNGYEGFQVKSLQSLSSQLYIKKVKIEIDPMTKKEKKVFEFTCSPTWSI